MPIRQQIKTILFQVSCCLYVILFTYAATSKILDYENFRAQLGQSPILSPFAEPVAYGVPLLEFLLAALLLTKFRTVALYFSTALMFMFTCYIFIILNYSAYVPCSCGGVLEKLGWTEHLIFNTVFVVLGFASLLSQSPNIRSAGIKAGGLSVAACVAVIALFLTSEDLLQNDNPFIRRFPPHVADYRGQTDLYYNSFYIAGYDHNRLYLGNYSARLRLWSVGRTLRDITEHRIRFQNDLPKFKRNVFRVADGHFFIFDGNVPAVYSGNTADWIAKQSSVPPPYFTVAEPIDSVTIAVRSTSGVDRSNILGTFSIRQRTEKFHIGLLQRQTASDGLFDTEGSLAYLKEINGLVYVYRYRNEYFVAEPSGDLRYRANTIDTMSKAHIKVADIRSRKEKRWPRLQ